MRFYKGNALVALFNTIFTLIKRYISRITYWKVQHVMRILKRCERKKKKSKSLNPHDYFFLSLMQLQLGLLSEDAENRFDILPTNLHFFLQLG